MPSKPRPPVARPYPNPLNPDPLSPQNPLVNRYWVLAAVAGMLLSAVLLGYGCLTLLVWQGQWQLIFHPSSTITATPASSGIVFEEVRFDATDTGQLQLDGWWIPAASNASASPATVLYLHGASGLLSNTLEDLRALHALGVNVFAFDYRGFGRSVWLHPSERSVTEDATAALRYLSETRHLSPGVIGVCGTGLGASVAAELAARTPAIPAVILINPQPPVLGLLQSNPRANLLPLRFLAHDRFDPGPVLRELHARKLFIATPATAVPVPYAEEAAEPKTVIHSPSTNAPLAGPQVKAVLQSFLAAAH